MIFSTYRHRFGKTVWLGFIPIRTAQRNTTKQRHQWEYTASAIRYTWITMKEIFFLGFFDGFFFLCLVVSVCCYFFSLFPHSFHTISIHLGSTTLLGLQWSCYWSNFAEWTVCRCDCWLFFLTCFHFISLQKELDSLFHSIWVVANYADINCFNRSPAVINSQISTSCWRIRNFYWFNSRCFFPYFYFLNKLFWYKVLKKNQRKLFGVFGSLFCYLRKVLKFFICTLFVNLWVTNFMSLTADDCKWFLKLVSERELGLSFFESK